MPVKKQERATLKNHRKLEFANLSKFPQMLVDYSRYCVFKTFLMTHKYKLVIAVTKRATASLEIVAPHNGSSPPLSVRTNGHRCLRQEKLEGFNLEGTLLLGSSIHVFVIVVVL